MGNGHKFSMDFTNADLFDKTAVEDYVTKGSHVYPEQVVQPVIIEKKPVEKKTVKKAKQGRSRKKSTTSDKALIESVLEKPQGEANAVSSSPPPGEGPLVDFGDNQDSLEGQLSSAATAPEDVYVPPEGDGERPLVSEFDLPQVKSTKQKLHEQKSLQDDEYIYNGYVNSFVGLGHNPQQAKSLATVMMDHYTNYIKPMAESAGLTMFAGLTEGRTRSAFYNEASGINKDAAKEYAANLAEGVRSWEDRMQHVAQMDTQISNSVIQPGRVWNDKSLFSKAAVGFSAGLYRMLQVTQGRIGGANPVIQAMQSAIQQDLASQELELNRLFKQRGNLRQEGMDALGFAEFKNQALQEGLVYRLGTIEAEMNKQLMDETLPLQTKAQYMKDIAEIGKMKMEAMTKLSQGYLKAMPKFKGGKGSGGGGRGKALGPTELNIGAFGFDIDGQTVIDVGDKTQKKELEKSLLGSANTVRLLREALAMGIDKDMPWDSKRILIKQRIDQALKATIASGGRAISDSDIETYARALGANDPNAIIQWASGGAMRKKLEAAIRAEITFQEDQLSGKTRGRVGYTSKPVDVEADLADDENPKDNVSPLTRIRQQSSEADTVDDYLGVARSILDKVTKEPKNFQGNAGELSAEFRDLQKRARQFKSNKKVSRKKVEALENQIKKIKQKLEQNRLGVKIGAYIGG